MKEVDPQRQRILELEGDAHARAADDLAHRAAVEPLQVTDSGGSASLAGSAC